MMKADSMAASEKGTSRTNQARDMTGGLCKSISARREPRVYDGPYCSPLGRVLVDLSNAPSRAGLLGTKDE